MNITLHDLLAITDEARLPSLQSDRPVIDANLMRAAIIARMDALDADRYRGVVGASIYDKITYLPGMYLDNLQFTLDPQSNDAGLLRVEVDEEGTITKVLGFGRPFRAIV